MGLYSYRKYESEDARKNALIEHSKTCKFKFNVGDKALTNFGIGTIMEQHSCIEDDVFMQKQILFIEYLVRLENPQYNSAVFEFKESELKTV